MRRGKLSHKKNKEELVAMRVRLGRDCYAVVDAPEEGCGIDGIFCGEGCGISYFPIYVI